jgi:outer membrane biosynthesis protein TonB
VRLQRAAPDSSALALIGTVLVHGVAVGLLYVSAADARQTLPPTYRVRLVAAPEPTPEARRAPESVDRPAAPPVAPATQRSPRNTAAKTPPPPVADDRPREAAPRTTPKTAPLAGERPSTGDDVATVSTEGIEFPFPEYLEHIVSEVLRRWQRPSQSTPLEAELAFFVHRDGSVTGLRFIRRSGNFAFDLEAQGAVEEAGRYRAFGELPAGWASDVLFVRFYFSGQRR